MWLNPFAKSDLPLTELELEDQQLRKRRILIVATGVIVLLVIGLLCARPALNQVRDWQARRHASKAFAAIDAQEWTTARDEAIKGYQLRPNEPEAIRAIARLFTRAGQADGLKFWKELREKGKLTRTDLRDEAILAMRGRELPIAEEAVKQLLAKDDGGPTTDDWLLAGQLALQAQDPDRAILYAREIFASTKASDKDQLQAILNLDAALRAKDSGDRNEVVGRLSAIARGSGPVSLEALVALAQRIQIPPTEAAAATNAMSIDEVIKGLETHPASKVQHKLLALDLNIREHPEEKDKLIDETTERYKEGAQSDQIALAAWLNSHAEYEKELQAIPPQRAMQAKELFFQHVDALGGLGRWDEIRRLIESEQFPLDRVKEYMYLARCFAQQNQTSGAENNWKRALEAAAGDLDKLVMLAEYAEKNGALDIAAAAYEAAVAVSPKARPAQQGRLRVAYVERDTQKIHAILLELLKLWPNDTAVQNDEAYARLLLMPDNVPDAARQTQEVRDIEILAMKLVEKERTSLPHRTLLALARLRLHEPAEALEVYKDINVPKTSLSTASVAVHAAVLSANGHGDDAKAESAQLPADKMLPEEKKLLIR